MQRTSLIVFGDLLSFWTSFVLILYLRYGNSSFEAEALKHLDPFIILYFSWVLVFYLFGLYDLFKIKPTIPHLKQFGLAVLVSFVIGAVFFYFVPIFGVAPKTNLIYQIASFGLLSFIFRRIVYSLYSSQIVRPAILVGKTPYLEELNATINNNPQIGLKIVSYTTDLNTALKKYSSLKDSVFVFENVTEKISDKDVISLYENNIEVIDVARAYERYLYKIPVGYISQTWTIENINTSKNLVYDAITRVLDIIFSIFVLIVLSPILLIALLFIYFYDRGPTVYSQERIGLNGKVFKLFKLRSMIVDSEINGAVWAKKNDFRITPVGRILRKIHLDEIPQMMNVLKGDITLVGPRPERPEFVSLLTNTIPNYGLRHIIKPGFTGWAQIKFRYARTEGDSKEKFEYDLYYIKNRNLFMNFGIILRTIQIIFTH
ncbi:MAG: exopolysaccharide biosynthesis polyprenyl glycosylphosphotransferase [bacterium]|nr:exopolysaccharide biosynthesis polyprenyl glycosylphosphotransferase [bacterium]